jgi:hypothetical protein
MKCGDNYFLHVFSFFEPFSHAFCFKLAKSANRNIFFSEFFSLWVFKKTESDANFGSVEKVSKNSYKKKINICRYCTGYGTVCEGRELQLVAMALISQCEMLSSP